MTGYPISTSIARFSSMSSAEKPIWWTASPNVSRCSLHVLDDSSDPIHLNWIKGVTMNVYLAFPSVGWPFLTHIRYVGWSRIDDVLFSDSQQLAVWFWSRIRISYNKLSTLFVPYGGWIVTSSSFFQEVFRGSALSSISTSVLRSACVFTYTSSVT